MTDQYQRHQHLVKGLKEFSPREISKREIEDVLVLHVLYIVSSPELSTSF
jgi:hypothetical protein